MARSIRHTPIFNNALGTGTRGRRAGNRALRHARSIAVQVNAEDDNLLIPHKNELPACDPNSWGGDGRNFFSNTPKDLMRK
jgi:hypothetical protein